MGEDPYYRRDLALAHHRGFGRHAQACASGILELLEPVRARDGLVLELGCGSGLLTQQLVAAGLRVIATDASPAMLQIAHDELGDSADIRVLALPDDRLPDADAVIAVGHPLNYLADLDAFDRAVIAIAHAVRPRGLLAFDVCDLEWGRTRQNAPPFALAESDWAMISQFSMPSSDRFIRDVTIFTANDDGSWRRDAEHHENVLVDAAHIPPLLAQHGIDSRIAASFGTETLPEGLRAIIGQRPN